jgi:hypothetical protein
MEDSPSAERDEVKIPSEVSMIGGELAQSHSGGSHQPLDRQL